MEQGTSGSRPEDRLEDRLWLMAYWLIELQWRTNRKKSRQAELLWWMGRRPTRRVELICRMIWRQDSSRGLRGAQTALGA